jgi:hypothetical protein
MAAGSIPKVVYLQKDDGAFYIGNVLYRLGISKDPDGRYWARHPLPIAASQFKFEPYDKLNNEFRAFVGRDKAEVFYEPDPNRDKLDRTVSSFLCTKPAWEIYGAQAKKFGDLWTATDDGKRQGDLLHGDYRPELTGEGITPEEQAALFTNLECLKNAGEFLKRVRDRARRGAPHGI